MKSTQRIQRHLRIMKKNYEETPEPPFLVLFINSICNMKCAHCFYWTSLNKKDDLTKEEIFELSRSLGRIENLNLSGGEPFIRPEFGEICRQFIQHNKVRQIYVPTNGYFTDRTIKQITETLKEPELELFVVELSLDGMPEFHDTFRVAQNSFKKSMETYDALVELQEKDPRLRIHCISTATERNMDEIKRLTTYLYDRCPKMDHHNLAIIRGDRKDPTLQGPQLKQYIELYGYIRRLWAPREVGRYGSITEPMLQWAKVEAARQQRQVVPCRAGRLSAVVYANGDVSVCEIHKPIGNIRQKSFSEIWRSEEANQIRKSIAARECFCTTEVFMWPSFTYPPTQLVRTMVSAKAWKRPAPLGPDEKLDISVDSETRLPFPSNGHGAEAPQGSAQVKVELQTGD
jgi:MoaA/NifB/PqqE/SkfB family radical SAM enzyme